MASVLARNEKKVVKISFEKRYFNWKTFKEMILSVFCLNISLVKCGKKNMDKISKIKCGKQCVRDAESKVK